MADEPDRQRSQYPPPDDLNRGYYPPAPREGNPRDDKNAYPAPDDANRAGHYQQGSPATGPPRDDRMPYPPPDPSRQPPYSYDPRAGQYQPPPHQWNGQYPPPQYPDSTHPAYQYPPPARSDGQHYQPPPDAYRLPPPFPGPGYPYPPPHYAAPQAPAPRQRTAIACKYCRKRKIRCSGYEGSPEGRCQNCVRFNQQCLFHPVSSQGAFVPASAVYGPQASATRGSDPQGDYRPQQRGYSREGEPPMLYGAHGQPLGPVNPRDPPPGNYPPPPPPPPSGYPHPYPNGSAPPHQGNGPAYDYRGQAPPHPEQIVGRKRSPPDDDPHNETAHSSQSPHPSSRPRTHEARNNSSGNGYDYPDPTNIAPISPATSTMSYQSHPPAGYYANGNGSSTQARNASPQSAHSYDSPRVIPIRNEGKTPPHGQPSSAGSGRSGMSVKDMITAGTAPKSAGLEPRDRNDNEMLSKLDGKKKQAV